MTLYESQSFVFLDRHGIQSGTPHWCEPLANHTLKVYLSVLFFCFLLNISIPVFMIQKHEAHLHSSLTQKTNGSYKKCFICDAVPFFYFWYFTKCFDRTQVFIMYTKWNSVHTLIQTMPCDSTFMTMTQVSYRVTRKLASHKKLTATKSLNR